MKQEQDKTLYIGRGREEMRGDYLDFINYVFGFNGNESDFLKLLPNLYKEQYHPCEHNYVVTEDGRLRAAIGVYPRDIAIGNEILSSHGVGNVAVHPYCRGKGYMKTLMKMLLKDMIDAGADMADLGGQRQRYQYFSFDIAAPCCIVTINKTNLRHCFRDMPLPDFTFVPVTEDGELLDRCIALQSSQKIHAVRPKEAFLDIVKQLYAVMDGDRFVGYCLNPMSEFVLCDPDDFDAFIRCAAAKFGDLYFKLPVYETDLLSRAERICDGIRPADCEMFTVFHYRRVISALLKLRQETLGLADGSMSFLVHGFAGDEAFRITVRNGEPSLEDLAEQEVPDLTLSHLEALAFFFSVFSSKRLSIPLANAWFPLPLFIHDKDHV